MYCLWDFLSIRKYRQAYVNDCAPEGFHPSIYQVYKGAFSGATNIYRGPAITLTWPAYFWSLPLAHQFILTAKDRERPAVAFAYALFVIIGLFTYRYDKKVRLMMAMRLSLIGVEILSVVGISVALRLV